MQEVLVKASSTLSPEVSLRKIQVRWVETGPTGAIVAPSETEPFCRHTLRTQEGLQIAARGVVNKANM